MKAPKSNQTLKDKLKKDWTPFDTFLGVLTGVATLWLIWAWVL